MWLFLSAIRRRSGLASVAFGFATLVILAMAYPAIAADEASADGVPGNGEEIRVSRPTWDTGWFQAELMAQLLTELGYLVDGPITTDNADFYSGVQDGSIDLWVNGWFPLHDSLLPDDGTASAVRLGSEVRGGALQGYMADRATVERLGIETLADLQDPTVAAAFDSDGDGRADLIGCNVEWACHPIVDHHLDAYGLGATVTHISADYGPLMRTTVDRFRAGDSVLFYTFTPNWTVGELIPGQDVVWIPVPFPSLPADIADQEPLTTVASVAGCLTDPCAMGFAPNDIRAVANTAFIEANPAIESLLDSFTVPLDDILRQNANLVSGEDSAVDIQNHARTWLADNRDTVDAWIADATAAHVAAGLALYEPPAGTAGSSDGVGRLRVVTRIAPPFVTYENGTYAGFSIDLMEMLAADMGAELDVYAVNSSAKLVDEVVRGAADVGSGAVAISSQREALADFSQPFFVSGLQILVADGGGGFFGGLGAVLRAALSRDLLILILVLVLVLVIAAHIIWLTERKTNPQFPTTYWAGIGESLWWAAVTATTVGYGDKTPKGATGRAFALVWMFAALLGLAYFTAGIAAAFAVDELEGSINGPADLRGHAVGVPVDSTAADYLAAEGIAAQRFTDADAAYDALLEGRIDAVVHDSAILKHFVATDPRGGVAIAGPLFAERGFGFVLPQGSELTESVDRALLERIESGDYERLHDIWFGATASDN